MKAQIRETRNVNQTSAYFSLEPYSGAHVGDNINTLAVTSKNQSDETMKAQILASRKADWATTAVSQPPTGTGRTRTPRTGRNQTEADEAMKAQIRETRNVNQTTAKVSLEPYSGAHVGDNIDTHAAISRNQSDKTMKAQILASRKASWATAAVSQPPIGAGRARKRNQNAASDKYSSYELEREEGRSFLLEPSEILTIDNDNRVVGDDIEEGTALMAGAAPDRERRAWIQNITCEKPPMLQMGSGDFQREGKVSLDSPNSDSGGRHLTPDLSNHPSFGNQEGTSHQIKRDSDFTTPGAFPSKRLVAFGDHQYRSSAAQEPEPSVVEGGQGNYMVTAFVVDENELETKCRENILRETVDAEMVLVETEENTEQNQPPILWKRYTMAMFVIFTLVMIFTFFSVGSDDDTIQILPTVTMSPSEVNEDWSGRDPALPPTLQAIQDRGYIRCRAVDSERIEGFGFSIDLVRTT
jgi:DNA-binding Lrp family transcriptional regulator